MVTAPKFRYPNGSDIGIRADYAADSPCISIACNTLVYYIRQHLSKISTSVLIYKMACSSSFFYGLGKNVRNYFPFYGLQLSY